jgi:hypothetical protein
MQSEAEYRAEAGQLVRQAEHAKSATHRAALLQHAETLLCMADEAARMQRTVECQDRMAS